MSLTANMAGLGRQFRQSVNRGMLLLYTKLLRLSRSEKEFVPFRPFGRTFGLATAHDFRVWAITPDRAQCLFMSFVLGTQQEMKR
jgi:hypothetical protein